MPTAPAATMPRKTRRPTRFGRSEARTGEVATIPSYGTGHHRRRRVSRNGDEMASPPSRCPVRVSEHPLRTGVVAVDALLHGDCARESRRRGGEDHHEAIAQVLHLGAPGGGDGLPEGREVLVSDLVPCLRRQRRGELGWWPPNPLFAASGREIRRNQGHSHGVANRRVGQGEAGFPGRKRGLVV